MRPFLLVLLLLPFGAVAQSPRAGELDSCMVRALHHMGGFHGDSALHWLGRALALARIQDDGLAEYHCLTNRAEVLYYEGLFTPAWKDLDRGMALAEALGDSLLVANVHNLRGLLHENIAAPGTAIGHFKRSLAHFPTRGSSRWPVTELHHIHGNLAHAHLLSGTLDSAGQHARHSLALALTSADARAVSLAGLTLGRVALQEGAPREALAQFERSKRNAIASHDLDVVLEFFPFEAEAWMELGRNDLALAAITEGRRYAEANGPAIGSSALRDLHRRTAALYVRLGDHHAALEAEQARRRADSAIAHGNLRTALNTQAELIRTDAELALQKERAGRIAASLERERQLKLAWTTAAAILLLAIVSIYFINKEKRQQRERLAALEMEQLRQEALIAELRVREQVGRDMHDDMGAGLSALKLRSEMALRVERDPGKRAHLTSLTNTAGELIGSMRQIIWALNTDQSELDDLVVYTTNYARTYCAEHGLVLEVDAASEWPDRQLTSEQRRNLFLVVKEALHNIVKHAAATEVLLFIRMEGERLVVRVEDDGTGMPAGTSNSMGNGLRNMTKRIQALGGTITVQGRGASDRKGTCVTCEVPLPPLNQGSIVR